MGDRKICCFAGHGKIYGNTNKLKEIIIKTAEELITNYGVTEFLVGHYGDFDRIATSCIRELKNRFNVKLVLVVPYLTKEINENKDYYRKSYDCIERVEIPIDTPKRLYIIISNEYMVNCSDYMICYIDHSYGGAYRTYAYAERKKNIKIFNIADCD